MREWGYSSLVGIVSRKLHSAVHFVRTERFYVLNGKPNPVEARLPCEIQCMTGYTDQLRQQLNRIKGCEGNWKRRFALSHRCYLVVVKDQAVGYGWVIPAAWQIGHERQSGPLAEDVAFLYDGITLDAYRGNRLGPADGRG